MNADLAAALKSSATELLAVSAKIRSEADRLQAEVVTLRRQLREAQRSEEKPAEVEERSLAERTVELLEELLVAVRDIRGPVFEARWNGAADNEGEGLGVKTRRATHGDDDAEHLTSGERLQGSGFKSDDLVVGHRDSHPDRPAEVDKSHNASP